MGPVGQFSDCVWQLCFHNCWSTGFGSLGSLLCYFPHPLDFLWGRNMRKMSKHDDHEARSESPRSVTFPYYFYADLWTFIY